VAEGRGLLSNLLHPIGKAYRPRMAFPIVALGDEPWQAPAFRRDRRPGRRLGLTGWILHGPDGKADGFAYERTTAFLIEIAKRLDARLSAAGL
jgi:hypothetical protein